MFHRRKISGPGGSLVQQNTLAAHLEVAKLLGVQSVWDYDGADIFGVHNLTVVGTPTSAAAILANGSNAIDFVQANPDYMHEPNATAEFERLQSSQWTMGCFFKPDATRLGFVQGLIGKYRASAGYRTSVLYSDATNVCAGIGSIDGTALNFFVLDGTAILANDVWYSAVSHDDGVMHFWVGEVGVDENPRLVSKLRLARLYDGLENFAIATYGVTTGTNQAVCFDGKMQYPFYATKSWGKQQHALFYNRGEGLRLN